MHGNVFIDFFPLLQINKIYTWVQKNSLVGVLPTFFWLRTDSEYSRAELPPIRPENTMIFLGPYTQPTTQISVNFDENNLSMRIIRLQVFCMT